MAEDDEAASLLSTLAFSSSDPDSDKEPNATASSSSASSAAANPEDRRRRRRRNMCWEGCGRPSSVCICPHLPSQPIPTSTHILLLHHPHHSLRPNHHNTLSTLPPLSLSLRNLHSIPGRKLRLGSHPLLDSLYNSSHSHSPQPALFLFPSLPSSPSLPLSLWARRTPPHNRTDPVLIVFDGTWTQAREMVAASLPFLSKFATHVAIGDCDAEKEGLSSFESELVVRKEPFLGCVSTMEAVARALRVLEPEEEGAGLAVEERLVGILRAMVGFQARHLKPVKPRVKMRKKKEMRKLMGIQEEGDTRV